MPPLPLFFFPKKSFDMLFWKSLNAFHEKPRLEARGWSFKKLQIYTKSNKEQWNEALFTYEKDFTFRMFHCMTDISVQEWWVEFCFTGFQTFDNDKDNVIFLLSLKISSCYWPSSSFGITWMDVIYSCFFSVLMVYFLFVWFACLVWVFFLFNKRTWFL